MAEVKPEITPPEHYQEDGEEGRVTTDIQALTQLNAAEINQQIMTARAYPRSITGFRRNMRELVTLSEDVAQSCLYALSRGRGNDKKVIEGPSARFAEVAMQSWGNARAGSRVVDIGEEYVTAQGFFYDLEKNMAVSYEVLRRITDREGNRFGADMIGVTANAACSIAIRNAILKGIPKAFWNDAYQDARVVSVGKGETIANKRQDMLKAFQPFGVEPAQIFALLGVKGIEDVTIDHMILLGGIRTAIKEGETTPEEAFAVSNVSGEAIPPRPRRDGGFRAPVNKEPEISTAPAKTATVEKPATVQAKEELANPTPSSAEMREQERQYLVKEYYAKLAAVTKVRDWPALLDEVLAMGFMSEGEEIAFNAACEARGKEIVNAAQAKKK